MREVLRGWLDGAGLRTVAGRAGVDRKTARRYVDAAVGAGLCREAGPGALTDELIGAVVAAVRPARPDGHGASWEVLAGREEQIRDWIGKDGLSIVKIEELLARSGCVVPYRTLHRFAVERCGCRPLLTGQAETRYQGRSARAVSTLARERMWRGTRIVWVRVAVVGAGVVGLSTSASLLQRGVDVTCYERSVKVMNERSAGSSRIFRLAHGTAEMVALADAARSAFGRWEQALGSPLITTGGCVVSGPKARLWAAAMAQAGCRVSSWTAARAGCVCPRLPRLPRR